MKKEHFTNLNIFIFAECRESIDGVEGKRYRSKKLGTTFNDRVKYVVHYQNLQTYLNLGMKLKEVHRVISFTQTPFLKKYIEFCTRKRKESKSNFGKNLWKFFSNANFGKFIERTRDRLECKITRTEPSLKRWISSPRFRSAKIISENLVIVFLSLREIKLDKAYAIGFTILERSKQFMYESYYNVIKPTFNGRCELIFTDTDSFFLEVKSEKQCDNLKKLTKILDFSNYPSSHPLYSTTYQNQLGYFKDEVKGATIDEFVGLRSKTYAMTIKGKDMKSCCKGVRKAYKKTIPFRDFKKCLQTICSKRITQYNILSKNHMLETARIDRLCFSSFDDKRFIFNCALHSAPYSSKIVKRSGRCYYCAKSKSLYNMIGKK